MEFQIIENYATKFKRYGEKRDGTFDSIEIHSIGTAQSDAEKVRDSMNQYSPGGIVHGIVSSAEEKLAVEILPWDNICWADAGYGNHHSFAVEICESVYMKYEANSARFTVWNRENFLTDIRRGYENAAEYAAIKCEQFGFDPLKKLSNGLYQVYSHQEANEKGLASAHVDPTHIWPEIEKTMDDFRREVKERLQKIKAQKEAEASYQKENEETRSLSEESKKEAENAEKIRYVVQTGAYVSRENAEKLAERLRKSGFEAIVKEK